MNRTFTILYACLFWVTGAGAQEFIPLWPEGRMPNSRGMKLIDSISNERIHRVGTPGMYGYFPSQQENSGAAVLICPGGGYERLAYIISGTQLAKWFNTMGISAFVLNYRLPTSPDLKSRSQGPLMDAQRALKIIHAHARSWRIDTTRIGIQGSSAGGHLAATAGTAETDISAIGDTLDGRGYRPRFMILISPVIDMGTYAHTGSRNNLLGDRPDAVLTERYSLHKRVNAATPAAFIVHAFNDKSVHPQNSLMFYSSLLQHAVSASLHIFPQGAHSIALQNNPGSTQHWTGLCEAWMRETGIIQERK